jgi:cobalt-zinc-cadmium efflux system outer membrane protein
LVFDRDQFQRMRTFEACILALFLYPQISVAGYADVNGSTNVVAGAREQGATLTLKDAKNMAFQNNWDLLAARSDVDLATARRIIAGEFPNPVLSAGTSKIDVDKSSATQLGNSFWNRSYDTIVAMNQLFEIGGKRSSRKAATTAGVKAAQARFADARRVLDQGVAKAYVNVLLAMTNQEILRQSAESLKQEAGIAEKRLKAGDISQSDKAQIEVAAQRLELDARAAEATALNAKIALEVLVGVKEPKGNWVPSDSLETLAHIGLPEPEQTRDLARPDVMAAEAEIHRTEAEVKLQKAMRVPDPTVIVQYEHEPPEQVNTLGLGVSLPLPLWNRNRGAIKAADAEREQAKINLEKTRAQATADVATAQVDYRSASSRLKVQKNEILPKSAGIVKTVSFAYENGGASLLDLLLAQRNDNEIRLATAQAAADTAIAVANLKAALNLAD